MDFDSLKSRAKRCLYEARYWWLAVALLEFIFLAAVCADTLWSSPESREFLKLASIAVVVGLAYSFFGIRQRLNANRSIRSAQLVFEGLMADFKGVEASNDRFRMELSESQLKCIDLQTKLDAATLDLEKARRENDGFREELKGAKANEKADLEKALIHVIITVNDFYHCRFRKVRGFNVHIAKALCTSQSYVPILANKSYFVNSLSAIK